MANYASTVINIALDEVGYLEKKSNKYLDDKTKNAGSANYTKYGRDMHKLYPSVMDFPAYWCDAFVDWCFQKAYGVSNAKKLVGGKFDDYTVNSAQLYKNKNAWGDDPKLGAQIFFKNNKRICHTGLVYDFDTKYVYTVEGNTSGASGVIANGGGVCKKKYLRTSSRIAGYGYPKYDAEPAKKKTDSKEKDEKKGYSGAFPSLPGRGYYTVGDGYETLKSYKAQIKRLQNFLNWAIGAGLTVDGCYGEKTKAAVIKFQKKYKLVPDGKFGAKSLAKAKTVKK